MSQILINTGTGENSGDGDSLQVAGSKINDNFTEIYNFPSVLSDIRVLGTKIITQSSNADIVVEASGTGVIIVGNIKIDDNNIAPTRSNDDLKIIPSGSGLVVIDGVGFTGTTISAVDSSSININENLVVDGTLGVSGATAFSSAVSLDLTTLGVTGLTTVTNISTSSVAFGDGITVDNLTFNDNTISSSSNADINLTPGGTGTVNISNLKVDSNINLLDNEIKTTVSNSNLEIRPSGSGKIEITSGASTIGITTTGNVGITGTQTVIGQLDVEGIQIKDNKISTDESNSNLLLSGNSGGNVVIDDLDIGGGEIDNTIIGASTPAAATFTTVTFDPVSGGTLNSSGVQITDNKITSTQSNDNLEFDANGSGKVFLGEFSLPTSDGATGQIFQTDGSKNLTFVTSPILLGVSDIQDRRTSIGYQSFTADDVNTGAGSHEAIIHSTASTVDDFLQAKYDSAWYYTLTRMEGTDSAIEFGTQRLSLLQGTNDGSTYAASLLETDRTTTGEEFDHFDGSTRVGTDNHVEYTADINNSYVRLRGQGGIMADGSTRNNVNAVAYYRIGVGDDDSSGNSQITVTADVDSTLATVDTWSISSYRGAKYFISMNNTDTNEVSNIEALAVHDGTDAYLTTFNEHYSDDNSMATFSADVSGGNFRLRATNGASGTLRITVYRIILADNESGSTSTNVNVISAKTLNNSTETTIDANTFRGSGNPNFGSSRAIYETATSTYDSLFIHAIHKDQVNGEFTINKYNICHGAGPDGSTQVANITDSHVVRTATTNNIADADAVLENGKVRLKTAGVSIDSTAVQNTYVLFGIGLGDSTADSTSGNVKVQSAVSVGGNAETVIDHVTQSGTTVKITDTVGTLNSFTGGNFDSVWYYGLVKDIINDSFATMKSTITHNNSDAFVNTTHVTKTDTSDAFLSIDADVFNSGDSSSTVRFRGTGESTNNTLAYYRIALGDDDSSGYVSEDGAEATIPAIVVLSSTTANIDTWASNTTLRGAKYFLSITNMETGETGNMEALVTHDGTTAYVVEYGDVTSGNDAMLTLTADIDSNLVRLRGTANSGANTRVTAYRILLADDEADRTGTNVNVIGDVQVGNYVVTTVDHVTATIDNVEDFSSANNFDSWSSGAFDSVWYHVVAFDQTNNAFSLHKWSVCHGTSSDSSAEAFITDPGSIRSETQPIVTVDADVNDGNIRIRATAHNDGSTTINTGFSAYRIGLGDNDSTGYSGEESTNATIVINTDVDSASESLDSWAKADYRGAKYYISINNDSKTEVGNLEALVVHDGTTAFINTYNEISTGDNPLATFTAAIDGSNVVVSVAGYETNLRITAYRVLLADDETDTTSTNVNVIGEVSVRDYKVTTIDHVLAKVENVEDFSSENTFDTFSASSFDSAWYHVICKDATNNAFSMHKFSVCHGTSSDSSAEAFITDSGELRSETVPVITSNADVNDGNVRVRVTAHNDGSSAISVGMAAYRIGLGDNDSTGYSGEQETNIVINTDVDSASETLDSWAHASYRGAKYYVSINNDSKTEVANVELLVVHNGSDAFITTYNEHGTGDNPLATFTAAISGSNVVVSAAGFETNLRITAYRILLADDEADRTGTNVNVIGEVTVSSSATLLDSFNTDTYQGAHYIIVGTKSNDSCIMEATVVSNGSEAFVSEGPQVSTEETPMVNLTVTQVSSTAVLQAASTTGSSTTLNAYRIHVAVTDPKTVLDSFASATYKGAHYIMVASNTASQSMIAEINLLTNGTDTFINSDGSISTHSTTTPLLDLSADYSGSTARLLAKNNVTGSNTTVNMYRIQIPRGAITTTDLIDSYASATYDGAYYITVAKNTNGDAQISELSTVTDGTSAFVSEGATINTSSSSSNIMEYTATYNDSKLELHGRSLVPLASLTVNAYRVHLKAPTSVTAVVDTWAHASYRGAKYYMSIDHVDLGHISNQEILVVHNGADAYCTIDENDTHSRLLSITVAINGSNVELTATPIFSDLRVRFYRILLADNESDASGTDFNTIGATTVSSSSTALDSFVDTQYTGAHYVVVAVNNHDGSTIVDASISEVTVVTNGTNAYVAQGNEVLTDTREDGLLNFTAAHDGSSTVTLSAHSQAGGSTTVNAFRIHMLAGDGTFSYDELDSFSASTYQGAHYISVAKDDDNNASISEISVVTDSTKVYHKVTKDQSSTSTPLIDYKSVLDSGTIKIRAESSQDLKTTTVNMYRIQLARGAGDASQVKVIDTFDASSFRGAKYFVNVADNGGGKFENLELNLTHDGSTVYISEFARLRTTSSDLVQFSAEIVSGEVNVKGTISNTENHVVTMVRRMMEI